MSGSRYWNSSASVRYIKGENDPHKRAKARVMTIAEDAGWKAYPEVPFECTITIGDNGIFRAKHVKYTLDLLLQNGEELMSVECNGGYHFATKKAIKKTDDKDEFLKQLPFGVDSVVSFTVEELDGNGRNPELMNDLEVKQRLGLIKSS